MTTYEAPIRDMRFILEELLAEEALHELPGFEDLSTDLIAAVLEEAGRFSATVLHPLNRTGDEEGCTYENGVVRTPSGFQAAYRELAAGGWTGLAAAPEFGGQGLPEVLALPVHEMLSSANLAFSIYASLSHGAYNSLYAFAEESLKATYLPPLVEGRWSGTMCLTEPHCGTDLGLLRTRAVAQDDGSYQVTGTKIFISAGEHDLTENILHLVLARTPDAPPGIKGVSLFLVPKILVKEDGALGARNAVRCGGIEEKMGIKASSTCVLNFDAATGYLVGSLHQGIRAMFTMMNSARLVVSVQGVAVAEVAYQNAVAYARERLQGRALDGPKAPGQAADPIIVHPDVRRMLLTMRAYVEGARALAGWVSAHLDRAHRHPDERVRSAADNTVSLLTPVVKALFTDLGSEIANLGVQILGGHGYIRENGMEQFVRDARICQIYEGANGIQAMDLVGRKLPAHMGRNLRGFFHPLAAYLERNQGDASKAAYIAPLAKSFGRLQRATGLIAQRGLSSPNEAGAAASEYLRLFGLVAMGYMWARMADIALEKRAADETGFYQAKLDTAGFYFDRLLPQTGALFSAIASGAGSVMALDEAAF